jgi:hypothetical protein
LFFISDFKLDVDSPYPIPQKETYKAKPDPMAYPKRHPKYSHLGKNLELVINKALGEEDPEKKAGFAHAIAYYMKLSYSNWHKELVHDDTIRAEMNQITGGQLEFSTTPFIKHRNVVERDDYPSRGGRDNRGRQQHFSNRNRDNRGGGGGRDNRGGGQGRDNRNNNGPKRDNRGGGGNNGGQGRDNRNGNFKKRY